MALDLASGPLLFTARELINQTPLGTAIEDAQAYLFNKTSAIFETGGYDSTNANHAATGLSVVAGAAFGGITKAVAGIKNLYQNR